MANPLKSKNYKNLIPFFFLAVAVIIAFLIITQFNYFLDAIGWVWTVITPFFYGFIIAYIINLPYSGLMKLFGKIKFKFVQKIKKPVALILAIIFVLGIIFMFFYLVMPHIIASVSFFVINLPIYYQEIRFFVDNVENFEFFGFYISVDDIYSSIQDALQNLSADDIFSSLNALLAVPSVLISVILAIISSIYILIEKDNFVKFLGRFIEVFTPKKVAKVIFEYTDKLNKNFKKYLYVQTLFGFIFGVVSAIVLLIIGSPYWVILAILLGVSNYIPYLGSIVATIVAVIVILFTQGLTEAIIATIVIFIIQQAGATILHPKLMGQSFKFSPLLVLVSITVGGAIAGIFGMVVAIPIAVVMKDMLEDITVYFESKRNKIRDDIDEILELDDDSQTEGKS